MIYLILILAVLTAVCAVLLARINARYDILDGKYKDLCSVSGYLRTDIDRLERLQNATIEEFNNRSDKLDHRIGGVETIANACVHYEEARGNDMGKELTKRVYTDEFKMSTIALMQDSGWSASRTARELGLPARTISSWVKKYGLNTVR